MLFYLEAIHVGWESGTRVPDAELDPEHAEHEALRPGTISAFFLGLERRSDALILQRAINAFPDEALSAILPGVALNSLASFRTVSASPPVLVKSGESGGRLCFQ